MQEIITQVKILLDSQDKKFQILNRLLVLTKNQEEILKNEEFDLDKMEDIIRRKGLLIDDLNKLDDGFEGVFSRVGEYLKENKESFKSEIEKLQDYISKIMELSVQITALEESNRLKMSIVMKDKKSEVKRVKMSSKTVAAYYKNMANTGSQNDSYFLDQKK